MECPLVCLVGMSSVTKHHQCLPSAPPLFKLSSALTFIMIRILGDRGGDGGDGDDGTAGMVTMVAAG